MGGGKDMHTYYYGKGQKGNQDFLYPLIINVVRAWGSWVGMEIDGPLTFLSSEQSQ